MAGQPGQGGRAFLARRLSADNGLRARVEAARTLGISLRRFEGWEPRTTYEYDDNGRVVSSIPESEWDDTQQGWMLALGLLESMRCGGCGGDLRETTDPDSQDKWVAELPIRCHRCTAIQRAQEAYDGRQPTALLWSAKRRR